MSNKNGSKVFEVTFGDISLNTLVKLNEKIKHIDKVENSEELFENILIFIEKFPNDIQFIDNLLKKFAFRILSSYFLYMEYLPPYKSIPDIHIWDIILNYIEFEYLYQNYGIGKMLDAFIGFFNDKLTESTAGKIKKYIDKGFNIYSTIDYHNCSLYLLIEYENEINKSILLYAIENNKDELLDHLYPDSYYDNNIHILHLLIIKGWDFNFIKELIIKYELQEFINTNIEYINYKDNEKYENCNLLQIYLMKDNNNIENIKWLVEQSNNQYSLISSFGYYIEDHRTYDDNYDDNYKKKFNCLTYVLLYCSMNTDLIIYLMDIHKNGILCDNSDE